MGSRRSWGDMSLFRRGHAAAQVSPGSADAGRSRGKAVLSGILGLTAAMVMAGGIVTVVRADHGEHGAHSVAAISAASGPVSTSHGEHGSRAVAAISAASGPMSTSSRHRGTGTATPIQALTVVSSTPGPD